MTVRKEDRLDIVVADENLFLLVGDGRGGGDGGRGLGPSLRFDTAF